jgi:hypothetical protein
VPRNFQAPHLRRRGLLFLQCDIVPLNRMAGLRQSVENILMGMPTGQHVGMGTRGRFGIRNGWPDTGPQSWAIACTCHSAAKTAHLAGLRQKCRGLVVARRNTDESRNDQADLLNMAMPEQRRDQNGS